MPGPNKINWRRLVAEAAAIALGVFLSLWADEWRTSRWEASEGRAARLRIAADLEKDTHSDSWPCLQGLNQLGSSSLLLFPAVAVVMISVDLLSALGPARRALDVQPAEALGGE